MTPPDPVPPDPPPLDLHDDDTLVELLGAALDDIGSVPAVARFAALAAFDLGHLEGELAKVVTDSAVDGPLAGARLDSFDDRFVAIESSRLRVELDLPVADNVVLGQVDPPGAESVIIEFASVRGVERIDVAVDSLGRFQARLRPGSMRMHFTTPVGPVVSPWIGR